MHDGRPKVAIINLYSGIWAHSLQVAKVANVLTGAGIKVTQVSCGSAIHDFCTVNESRSRKLDSAAARLRVDCLDCKFSANLGPKNELIQRITVETYKTKGVEASAFKDFQLAKKRPLDLNFKINGVPVIQLSLYEVILKFKKTNLEFTDEEFKYYETTLFNSILFTKLGEKFLLHNPDVEVLICYAPQYALNNCFLASASLAGKKIYFLDGAVNIAERYESVTIRDWSKYGLHPAALAEWPGAKKITSGSDELERLARHKKELRSGKSFSVYSSRAQGPESNFREVLGLGTAEPFVLLALSSFDEMFAGQIIGAFPKTKFPGTVFRDQYDWVAQTINWFKDKEMSLVIRFHPRDLPNKRDKQTAEQAGIWSEMLINLPKNIYLNTPDQEISIHDLLSGAHGFVTGWSSTALEALDYGLPVVTYDEKMPAFPRDIHWTGNTKKEYFKNLEKLLTTERNDLRRQDADRWLVFNLVRGTIRLSGRILESRRLSMGRLSNLLLSAIDRYLFFLWRPLEYFTTTRTQQNEAQKLIDIITGKLDSIYELERYK